jgi:hypothetical protein
MGAVFCRRAWQGLLGNGPAEGEKSRFVVAELRHRLKDRRLGPGQLANPFTNWRQVRPVVNEALRSIQALQTTLIGERWRLEWVVKTANIPQYIRAHAHSDLIVEFDDGDKYPASTLDFQGENEDGEFEVCAAFENCIGASQACQQALAAGSPEKLPNCWWTSTTPRMPVGMQYTLARIRSIRDNEAGYYVFVRESAAES